MSIYAKFNSSKNVGKKIAVAAIAGAVLGLVVAIISATTSNYSFYDRDSVMLAAGIAAGFFIRDSSDGKVGKFKMFSALALMPVATVAGVFFLRWIFA